MASHVKLWPLAFNTATISDRFSVGMGPRTSARVAARSPWVSPAHGPDGICDMMIMISSHKRRVAIDQGEWKYEIKCADDV